MLTVVIIMSLGMLTGFLLRHKAHVFKKVDRWVTLTIYLLLFLLGLSVGKNEIILKNIHYIGNSGSCYHIGSGSRERFSVLDRFPFLFQEEG